MDIQRPSNARAKKIKRIIYVTVAVLAIAGVTAGAVATAFVPGSPMSDEVARVKHYLKGVK